jgi:isopenicillin N synthase-like dioxygenase
VDAQSYAGYIASGEEITDGIPDYSEIFTVTKDLPLDDQRVMNGWPCHGPCPWPDSDMANVIQRYMDDLAANGERMLQLIEFGLHVPPQSLTKYTGDGWHHLRMLRYASPRNLLSNRPVTNDISLKDFRLVIAPMAEERKAGGSAHTQTMGC